MAFSWANHKLKAKKHYTARVKSLVYNNQEFRARHSNIVKEVETGNTVVELKKFVDDKFAIAFKYGTTPKNSVIIKRMNRNV